MNLEFQIKADGKPLAQIPLNTNFDIELSPTLITSDLFIASESMQVVEKKYYNLLKFNNLIHNRFGV